MQLNLLNVNNLNLHNVLLHAYAYRCKCQTIIKQNLNIFINICVSNLLLNNSKMNYLDLY